MRFRPSVCAAVLLLLVSGCRDRKITTYRAPKDPVAAAAPAGLPGAAGGGMAATAVPTGSSRLNWTAPADWTAMPDRPMRKATFAVKGADGAAADLSITSFPGDTGGLLANVNRWRGQLGLSPLADSELSANVTHLDVGDLHLDVTDFSGNANGAPTRMLGAILPYEGETWFFKLMGPEAVVEAHKPAFLTFLRTVSPR